MRVRSMIGFAIFVLVFINFRLWKHLEEDKQPTPIQSNPFSFSRYTQEEEYPYPVFVVGMPKSGTTSLYSFFHCNGIKSSHYCCCGSNRTHTHCNDGGKTCSECIRNNIKQNRPVLQECGDYKVYAQLDAEHGKSVFLPQRFHLDKLHSYAPNATFILNLRPEKDWLHSVTNWWGLGGRFLRRFHVDIEKEDRNQALVDIYNNHSEFIRNFTRYHPSHKLLEVDISQAGTGKILASKFHLKESCWGKHNVNRKVAAP